MLAIALANVACGIGVRRDYSTIPPGRVGFDDMCGLQDYFDTLDSHQAAEPSLVSAVDIEAQSSKPIRGGKNLYRFETDFQLKHIRRVLNENWKGLPEQLAAAKAIDIEVHWSERSGVKRVVTDGDAELVLGRETFPLPYQVCLSEILYGEPLYRQRREMTGGSLPERLSRPETAEQAIARRAAELDAAAAAAKPVPPGEARPEQKAAAPAAPSPDGGTTNNGRPPVEARPVFKAAPPAQ